LHGRVGNRGRNRGRALVQLIERLGERDARPFA
jgi:hypothetical protein